MAVKKNYFKQVADYKKAHPRATHQAACTAVSKENKKISGVKTKTVKTKTAAPKKAAPLKVVKKTTTSMSIGSYMNGAKKLLITKLGRLEADKFVAKKKSDKNRFAREIALVKKDIRKLL